MPPPDWVNRPSPMGSSERLTSRRGRDAGAETTSWARAVDASATSVRATAKLVLCISRWPLSEVERKTKAHAVHLVVVYDRRIVAGGQPVPSRIAANQLHVEL